MIQRKNDSEELLKQSGFIDIEIEAYLKSKMDTTSKSFHLMLKNRKQWVENLKGRGLTPEQIQEIIEKYYEHRAMRQLGFYPAPNKI